MQDAPVLERMTSPEVRAALDAGRIHRPQYFDRTSNRLRIDLVRIEEIPRRNDKGTLFFSCDHARAANGLKPVLPVARLRFLVEEMPAHPEMPVAGVDKLDHQSSRRKSEPDEGRIANIPSGTDSAPCNQPADDARPEAIRTDAKEGGSFS